MNKSFGILIVLSMLLSACAQPAEESAENSQPVAKQQVEETENSNPVATQDDNAAAATNSGNFITLSEYESAKNNYIDSDVVLFFNANWCSTCKTARDNIQSNLAAIPPSLTIVMVDFDTEKDLRKKYGVVIQHTFIQIDASGAQLAKWSGSVTVATIVEKII